MGMLKISDIIEVKHVTSILVCLLLRGPQFKSVLSRSISTNPRMGEKIDFLVDAGVLEAKKNGRGIDIALSPTGEILAKGLYDIELQIHGVAGDEWHMYGGDMLMDSRAKETKSEWYSKIYSKNKEEKD